MIVYEEYSFPGLACVSKLRTHAQVNVISKRGFAKLIEAHLRARRELPAWYKIVGQAAWISPLEVRNSFPSADFSGDVLIFDIPFNILQNEWRLIRVASCDAMAEPGARRMRMRPPSRF